MKVLAILVHFAFRHCYQQSLGVFGNAERLIFHGDLFRDHFIGVNEEAIRKKAILNVFFALEVNG